MIIQFNIGSTIIAELEYFSGVNGPSSVTLKITFSNGTYYYGTSKSYEYEETRIPGDMAAGYYRFLADNYWDGSLLKHVSITPVWTDWYYLTKDMSFSGGYPY